MLKQRIITAAWLAPLVLAGLFGLDGGAFALFTALIVLLGTWEWANLAGITRAALRANQSLLGNSLPCRWPAVASYLATTGNGPLGAIALLGRF